ncbi:hypothetical protein KUCAC02_014514 [Chaenocephalus aceratus]|uniref:Uncharacterized protein n=1 Tax=Chaenocephalus aceratus TaxID=36190 RepID=A0ACB9WFK0_CHAAC|nr:hypothetical protein KUCAC02_014514 [Chaenocephalus aceratus]
MPGPGSTSRQCSSCCMSLNVACKTCKFCKAVQPRKLRLNKKMEKFDTKANTWVQAQKRNATSSHLRDQAALVLEKCQALGARGVLFLARPGIKKDWTCEAMMPRCNVSTDASTCLRKMAVLFEFVAKGWSHTEPAAASEAPQPPAENSPATSKVHIATADTPTECSGNLSEEMHTLTLIPVPAASTDSLPSPSAASQPGRRKKGLPTERSSTPRAATSVANGCRSATGEGMKKRNKVGGKWEDTWEPASQFSQGHQRTLICTSVNQQLKGEHSFKPRSPLVLSFTFIPVILQEIALCFDLRS